MIRCACGKPLHYKDKNLQARVQELVDKLGEYVKVRVDGSNINYLIPRHFIALHKVKAKDLPYLAAKYDFKVV